MTRDPYRIYTGKELIEIEHDTAAPIVEGLLYEEDYVMVVGKAKTNKSIFTMQMSCAISSGSQFLSTFDVPKPRVVWYFATEGKDDSIRQRYKRMIKEVPSVHENIVLVCSPNLRFNTNYGVKKIKEIQKRATDEGWPEPDVIVIDALYKAIAGSMKSDEVVTSFLAVLGEMADRYKSAVILVHHKTKTMFTGEGDAIERGDESAHGSMFLINAVDHVINISGDPSKKTRSLRVDTQRSGDIVEKLHLELIEPDPLYMVSVGGKGAEHAVGIHDYLLSCPDGATCNMVCEKMRFSRSTFYNVIDELIKRGLVRKDSGSRPVIYRGVKNELDFGS